MGYGGVPSTTPLTPHIQVGLRLLLSHFTSYIITKKKGKKQKTKQKQTNKQTKQTNKQKTSYLVSEVFYTDPKYLMASG